MSFVLLCTGCHLPFKSDGSSMTCPDCIVQQKIGAEHRENQRLTEIIAEYEDWLVKYKKQNSELQRQSAEQNEVITKLNKELESKR